MSRPIEDLVIYGMGAVGRMAYQIVRDSSRDEARWNLLGFLDDREVGGWRPALGRLGGVEWLADRPTACVVLAVGNPQARARLSATLARMGHHRFATLIHPLAWLGERTTIGAGSIIYPGVTVDFDVRIGDHALVNKSTSIGHDAVIGNFVTIAPGVNVGGGVTLGTGCDIGINSCSLQNVTIGEWTVIGAGAVVLKSLPACCTAVGVPARIISQRVPPEL